jgi:hypothetical protein
MHSCLSRVNALSVRNAPPAVEAAEFTAFWHSFYVKMAFFECVIVYTGLLFYFGVEGNSARPTVPLLTFLRLPSSNNSSVYKRERRACRQRVNGE